jgi:hypothetical protein
MNSDKVAEEYQQGNADKRMNLYLYFRELRDAFDRIDPVEPEERFVPCCAS